MNIIKLGTTLYCIFEKLMCNFLIFVHVQKFWHSHYIPRLYKKIYTKYIVALTDIDKLDLLRVDELQGHSKVLNHLHLLFWVLVVAPDSLGGGKNLQEFH